MLCLRQTTIRVRFGDLTQLEKVFPSSSKIRAVYAFVRDALREDVKPIKFVLCAYVFYLSVLVWSSHIALWATASNPPPRELKVSDPAVRDLTLAELGLAPSSVLHLRFVDDELNRKSLFRPFPRFPFALCPCPCCPPKKRSGLICDFSLNVTRFGRASASCIDGPGTCRRSSCTSRLRRKSEKGSSSVVYRISV